LAFVLDTTFSEIDLDSVFSCKLDLSALRIEIMQVSRRELDLD
jgi:hypothetical protein